MLVFSCWCVWVCVPVNVTVCASVVRVWVPRGAAAPRRYIYIYIIYIYARVYIYMYPNEHVLMNMSS